VVAVVLALVIALLNPVFEVDPECPGVEIVGVRGSGQDGYGEQVRPIVEAIRGSLASRGHTVASSPLEYTAVSVSDSFGLVLLNGEYDRSVMDGVSALDSRLQAIKDVCHATDIVLVGYSQGAQVVKVALENTSPIHRIAAIVLLADPTRDSAQRGITRLGDIQVEQDGAFGAIALPDYARVVAIDVCAQGDGICERGRRSFIAHTFGYTDVTAHIVSLVAAEFQGRPSGTLTAS
jgi:hypothetical protein